MSAATSPEVIKESSMVKQKEMIAGNYDRLTSTKESGEKVVSTFVPGNLNELLMCFDFARSLPETNALQNGMRKKSGKMIMDAERDGQSEDVCTYVKADLGMMMGGEIGPTGEPLPRPDLLLLSYTGCFTFMKWFELIRHKYGCETVMLHVPYQGANPQMTDLLSGRIGFSFIASSTTLPLIQSGKLRALAVTTAKRSELLPDVPTLAEQGFPDVDVAGWFAMIGPKGLPAAQVDRLHKAVVAAFNDPDVKATMAKQDNLINPTSPDAAARFLMSEQDRYARLVSKANIKLD